MINALIEELNYIYPHIKDKSFELEEVVESLKDFDSLIEMDQIKESVCDIVRAHLFSLLHDKSFQNNYHNILCGPPGVGKTTVAKKLSKIFKAFNLIGKPRKIENISHYRHHLMELYEHYNHNKNIPINIIKHYWNTIKDSLETNLREEDSEIVVCGREDLIAGFSGQSALKTLDFLVKNKGKCIIIEEAYLLWTGENDGYGMEALTVLNRFMEEFRNEIIIIMTGYRELISSTIFKAQPGLKRRFQWYFELEGYSPKGLSLMFKHQMKKDGWDLEPILEEYLEEFFNSEISLFPHFGGDIERFAWICKAVHSSTELLNYFQNLKNHSEMTQIFLSKRNFLISFEKYKSISNY